MLQEFARHAGEGLLVDELRAQAAGFAERDDVLTTRDAGMTTSELVACEQRLIAAALGRAEEGCGVVPERALDRALAAHGRPLTGEQHRVVRETVSSGAGVSVIEALAGTGKTYTAGALRAVYEHAGYEVIGVAPTARAARELTEQARIPGRTIDRLLLDLDLGDELPNRAVLVLDEAGMAPTRQTARLLEVAREARMKVVAIGDPRQLSSVQAGGWLSAVARRSGAARLTEVMRQRDPAERRALAALHRRQPNRYLAWARAAGKDRDLQRSSRRRRASRPSASGRVVSALDGLGDAVMITRDNDTRAALNEAARERLSGQGLLGERRIYGSLELATGDRIVCRRNDRLADVDNGMRGTVVRVDRDRVRVETDGGSLRDLTAAYVEQHVEHAYTLTGHAIQGGTVEVAVVLAAPRDLTAGWSYTALSRARGDASVDL